MPYGLYLSAEGAIAQNRRLEVIANNLANVDTIGFKRDLAFFQARYGEAAERGASKPGTVDDISGGTMVRATATDYSPGPMENTGRPQDLALNGPGFFTVRRGNETLLTRAGNFLVRDTDELVTAAGDLVLDDAGSPIELDPTLPFQINPEGIIEQAGGAVPLGLVQPASMGDLVKVGDNFFRPLGEVSPLNAEMRQVAAGFLEQSTVQPTTEMMQMIETSRAFEANVNMIRTQDQLLGTLIGRVLRA